VEETPYPKKRMRLPVILSRDEVARLTCISHTPSVVSQNASQSRFFHRPWPAGHF
jgi:hypothetical protein